MIERNKKEYKKMGNQLQADIVEESE